MLALHVLSHVEKKHCDITQLHIISLFFLKLASVLISTSLKSMLLPSSNSTRKHFAQLRHCFAADSDLVGNNAVVVMKDCVLMGERLSAGQQSKLNAIISTSCNDGGVLCALAQPS
jgi:hypothetical protein